MLRHIAYDSLLLGERQLMNEVCDALGLSREKDKLAPIQLCHHCSSLLGTCNVVDIIDDGCTTWMPHEVCNMPLEHLDYACNMWAELGFSGLKVAMQVDTKSVHKQYGAKLMLGWTRAKVRQCVQPAGGCLRQHGQYAEAI